MLRSSWRARTAPLWGPPSRPATSRGPGTRAGWRDTAEREGIHIPPDPAVPPPGSLLDRLAAWPVEISGPEVHRVDDLAHGRQTAGPFRRRPGRLVRAPFV